MTDSKHGYNSHNVSNLVYHFVCPTKYRRVVVTDEVNESMKQICEGRGNALFLELDSYPLDPSDFEIGMEATGHYWLSVYSFLFEKSFLIHVINPIQTDGTGGTEIRRRKNDTIDSALIADLIRYG